MQYAEYINSLFFKSARAGIPLSGTFELTARCNLRCRMCYIHRQESDALVHGQELSAAEWIKIAEKAREEGMLLLLLTGGEPLLRPDFARIYTACHAMGLVLSLNTNGSLLEETTLQVLADHPPQRVNLTLYGSSPETYGALCQDPSAYQRAYRAVDLLLEAGIPLKLNFSATPENLGDLSAVAVYAKSKNLPLQTASYLFPPLRAGEASGGEVCTIPGAGEGAVEGFCSPPWAAESVDGEVCFRLPPEMSAQVRWQSECDNLSRDDLLRRAEAIARNREIPVLPSECQDMPTEHIRCRAGAASFWITYHGQMRPCGMMKAPSAPVGEDFRRAWNQIRSQREKIMVPAPCTACRYRTICEACPAVCMAETGEFASVPTYLCRKMEAYAAMAAHWYEEVGKKGQEKVPKTDSEKEPKKMARKVSEKTPKRVPEGPEGCPRESTGRDTGEST